MKKIWRRLLVLLVIFLVAASAFALYRHFRAGAPVAEQLVTYSSWESMTLPIVYTEVNGHPVDILCGYTSEIRSELLEDRLMLVHSDGSLPLTVLCYDCSLEAVRWEVLTRDNSESLAQAEVEQWSENHETAVFTLDLSQIVTQLNREYRLRLTLTTTSGQDIDYYTRLRRIDSLHAVAMVDYVTAFHAATFDKAAAAEYAINLESDGTADDGTFGESTLHSSYQQLTWGDLNPVQIGEASCSILEMDESFGSFYLEYEIQAEDSNSEIDRFLVTEYFSLQWSEKRSLEGELPFYLMDYHRTVEELLSGNDTRLKERGLDLGIQYPERVKVTEAPGDRTLFQTAGELWCYQSDSRKLNRLFSFREEDADPRRYVRRYNIRVLETRENGDVSFLVYGYMNSGDHEGQMGVSCLSYSMEENALTEMFFLPYSGSFEDLSRGVETLSCMSENGEVYLMVGDTVYSVNWEGSEIVVLVDHVSRRHLAVNDAQTAIAWDMELRSGETGSVQVFYLETGESQMVGAGSGDWVAPCGFIEEDCVIGIGHSEEEAQAGAVQVQPYYAIMIRDAAGKEVARYERDGIRISSVTVSNGQVLMERLQQEGDSFRQIGSDTLIRNTNPNLLGPEWLVSENDGDKERVWLLAVPITAGAGDITLTVTDQVCFASGEDWNLPVQEDADLCYYGWAEGVNVIVTDTAGAAIAAVYDDMGAVSDSRGHLVWCRTGRQNTRSLRVAEKAGVDISESRKECLKQILASQGLNVAALEALDPDLSAMDAIDALFPGMAVNLTGAPLRSLLYYIEQTTPVLLIDTDRKSMLLAGYDPFNVVIYDPVQGSRYKMGQNDATEWLEKNAISAIGFLTD